MNKVFVATRLEAETHSELKALADRRDRTVAYLVRKAVEQFVETEQQKNKGRAPAA